MSSCILHFFHVWYVMQIDRNVFLFVFFHFSFQSYKQKLYLLSLPPTPALQINKICSHPHCANKRVMAWHFPGNNIHSKPNAMIKTHFTYPLTSHSTSSRLLTHHLYRDTTCIPCQLYTNFTAQSQQKPRSSQLLSESLNTFILLP